MQQQEFVRLKSMYINRDFHKIKEEFMKTLGDMNDMQVQHYQFKDLVT
jgi:cyclophilin family peptidyl-prolyl cis-trans isomerase